MFCLGDVIEWQQGVLCPPFHLPCVTSVQVRQVFPEHVEGLFRSFSSNEPEKLELVVNYHQGVGHFLFPCLLVIGICI